MKFIENISRFFDKKRNLYIMLTVGIIILISANFLTVNKSKEESAQGTSSAFNSEPEEERLANILSKVEGAGKTEVMITLENDGEKVALRNSKISKTSKNGAGDKGNTSETSEEWEAVMNGSNSNRNPFIIKETAPRVRGVLVVSEGGGDKNVRYEITNAVAAVLDVPYYRIRVLKKSK